MKTAGATHDPHRRAQERANTWEMRLHGYRNSLALPPHLALLLLSILGRLFLLAATRFAPFARLRSRATCFRAVSRSAGGQRATRTTAGFKQTFSYAAVACFQMGR